MIASAPKDKALPQLPVVLDPELMTEVFASLLQAHGVSVDGCTVERVKYRPGRNATLGYRLALRDEQGRSFDQPVAARLCGGEGAARSARAAKAALSASRAGPALRWLPSLDMLTWWWPNDAKLRATHALADRAGLQRDILPPLLEAIESYETSAEGRACGSGHSVDAKHADIGRIDIVQYVPETRLCARVELLRHGRDAKLVYAKAGRDPDARVAYERHARIQASQAWASGRLSTPRALLWHEATQTWWQQALAGRPLADVPTDVALAAIAPLGSQLAALHGCGAAADGFVADTRINSITSSTRITPESMRERLAHVVDVLAPLLDEQAVKRAAHALEAGWSRMGSLGSVGTLHGDFHARNILVDASSSGTKVSLIDLDGLCEGPVALELGAWIADSMYLALLDGAPAGRDRHLWRTLLAAYVDAGGADIDPALLRWATAWNLLTLRAWRCVVNLKPGRLAVAPRLVAWATALAEGGDDEVLP